MEHITGQLFFRTTNLAAYRKAASPSLAGEGRELWMVAGILAIPVNVRGVKGPGYPILSGEQQYTVMGSHHYDTLLLTIPKTSGVDLPEEARGQSIGGLLTQPIWRC